MVTKLVYGDRIHSFQRVNEVEVKGVKSFIRRRLDRCNNLYRPGNELS